MTQLFLSLLMFIFISIIITLNLSVLVQVSSNIYLLFLIIFTYPILLYCCIALINLCCSFYFSFALTYPQFTDSDYFLNSAPTYDDPVRGFFISGRFNLFVSAVSFSFVT